VAASEAELTGDEQVSSSGAVELLADADRPGGWLLLIDRIRQSYVDLDDPTYLDFEYVQSFADVLDALPAGPLAVTHIGGGACTLARYVAATRPGSSQIVLEPDAALTEQVRARLPFARGVKVRIRPVGGREGLAALPDSGADVVVLDAFAGGRVPAELTSREFVADVARILRPDGLLLANVADGGPPANKRGGTPTSEGVAGEGVAPLTFTRRLVATLRAELPNAMLRADPSVLKARRFGNVVIAASRADVPVAEISRIAASAMFPQRVIAGQELAAFVGGAAPLTDADAMRSPAPPDETWRVGG
jgi:SAM-dependent methyltransferase